MTDRTDKSGANSGHVRDMSATERLRALLTERGVEWRERQWGGKHSVTTFWHARGVRWHYRENRFGELRLHADGLDPEQAVAATLGPEDAYTREDVESAFVSGYSLGSLPVGSDPQWDQNEQTVDEHMAELGWVRKDAVTLGTGTCHDVGIEGEWFECDECGCVRQLLHPRYCPNCGRKVEE